MGRAGTSTTCRTSGSPKPRRGSSAWPATLRLDPRRVSLQVIVGPAACAIVRYAGERGADLLVLGSHGRGVIRRFLLGSVAERVLREAGCPVMIVPDRVLHATVAEARTLSVAVSGGAA